ncbi:MAG TPA: flagellar export protein FliJ [Candidatus Binatia bacterium]|nr:flagellar export protein FliJ [Candidatus Binatia bacterium]
MPRFRFRLQTVLDHRDRIERDKKRLLALAQRALNEAEKRLAEMRADYERTGEELRVKHAELDAMELYNYYAHMDYVLRGIREVEVQVTALALEVEHAKVALLMARRDKKILETLKERRRETFENEQAATEQKLIDDLNSRRHGRESNALGGTSSW